MILPIFIDSADITSQFDSITKENIENLQDNIAKGLAAGFARQLEQEAQNALHQTRQRYIRAIRLIDSGRLEGIVLLDYSKDKLIQMIEEGASAFDMKEGFLNSSKVKYTKDGRKYLTIPFRLSTPGAVAESDVFSGTLPDEVYQIVKNKVTDIPVSGGGSRSQGLTLGEIPTQFQQPATRPQINNADGNPLFNEYKHKNSIYEGLVKRTDGVTGQSSYGSFRRVAEEGTKEDGTKLGSDPDSWISKGIQPHYLIEKALSNFNIENETQRLLDFELDKLGFDV